MTLALSGLLSGIQGAFSAKKPGIVYDPKHPIFENVDAPVAPPEVIHHDGRHLNALA